MISIPRIYVACLASYNNAILHGKWLDVEDEAGLREGVKQVLQSSPIPEAEEWAIHDYEGFESLSISEYEGVASVIEKAEFVEQHGELGCLVYRTIADDLAEAARMMEEDYIGEYRSTADYAEELITETTPTLPEQLLYYMDWERLARDMELNSEFHSIETGFEQVHIFVVS